MNQHFEAKGLTLNDAALLSSIYTLYPIIEGKNNDKNQQTLQNATNKSLITWFKRNSYNTELQRLNFTLLKSLETTMTFDKVYLKYHTQDNKKIRQYLRKFSFFYYSFMKRYPNDLNKLSQKKMNMIAIKTLFFINSL